MGTPPVTASGTAPSVRPPPPEFTTTGKYWWQDAGLRRLYLLVLVAILSSATNGYDGYVDLQFPARDYYLDQTAQ